MSASPTRVLLDDLAFGEGPRWHDGRLWFSDMHSHVVLAVDLEGNAEEICRVAARPSGLGWLPDGRLLVVSMQDRRLLRLEPNGLELHADLSGMVEHNTNDMVTDAQGRCYVGNFGFDLEARAEPKTTQLILVEPDGVATAVADELLFPNGTVISDDGRTLVVGETFGRRLTAFDLRPDGRLENRRTWATLPEPAVPDGICLDAEGAIWVASPTSAEVLRVREGGEVLQRIPVATQAFACMLGGEDRRTLFICTASSSRPEECSERRDGRIEVVEVDVPGAGLP